MATSKNLYLDRWDFNHLQETLRVMDEQSVFHGTITLSETFEATVEFDEAEGVHRVTRIEAL